MVSCVDQAATYLLVPLGDHGSGAVVDIPSAMCTSLQENVEETTEYERVAMKPQERVEGGSVRWMVRRLRLYRSADASDPVVVAEPPVATNGVTCAALHLVV